jgi:hypothetical protein
MANIKIASEAAVFAAADGLKLRGEEPTYERVVEVLGGGSNSTIKPHLINWKQMSGGHSRPTPESVLARAAIFAEGVWGAALKEAQSEIDRAKQTSDAEIDRSKQALSSSMEISEQLEKERDDLAIQLEAVRLDCLEARIRLQQVDELKLELAQAHQSVEAHRRECESLTQEIATLRGENNVLRDQGKQLLAQVTSMAPRSRATSGRAGKSTS